MQRTVNLPVQRSRSDMSLYAETHQVDTREPIRRPPLATRNDQHKVCMLLKGFTRQTSSNMLIMPHRLSRNSRSRIASLKACWRTPTPSYSARSDAEAVLTVQISNFAFSNFQSIFFSVVMLGFHSRPRQDNKSYRSTPARQR